MVRREAKIYYQKDSHIQAVQMVHYKEMDIMDVWFDSGSSAWCIIRPELTFPADLYLRRIETNTVDGFNSSLTTSVAVHKQAPYKAVLSQGFVMDGKARR